MPVDRLSARQVETAKPREKVYRVFDGEGLYLQVQPSGSRYWRLKFRFGGKEKTLSLGVYPQVSLREARDLRFLAKKQLAQGLDPSAEKMAARKAAAGEDSFQHVATAWFEVMRQGNQWSERYARKYWRRLALHVLPKLGTQPVSSIETSDISRLLESIAQTGRIETAHRSKRDIALILDYAHQTGRMKERPPLMPSKVLPPLRPAHHSSITEPARIGQLLVAIDGYWGTYTVKAALQLAPLVFLRPGELRQGYWSEIESLDGDQPQWRIPAQRMKRKSAPHLVPLSQQAVAILRELAGVTGPSGFIFPGARSESRPMSENTVNAALRNLGFSGEEICGHGFRSMASTLLNEFGWRGDAIERQLHHLEGNEVRAAYNYAEHLDERRQMMQSWADYLDTLKARETTKM